MEYVSNIDYIHHPLSSLIAADGGDRVVISASHLAEKAGIELQLVIDHGADIAQKCSNKFATGPQIQYDWIVVFETETQSFVAISRRIARNALGRK